jgi:hypothetical protein
MATRSTSRTNLVGFESLSFIRAQNIQFAVTDVKPSTRFYGFFDGVNVEQFITPTGGTLGGALMSDASGAVSGTFALPGSRFNTGTRVFKLIDSPVFDTEIIAGSLISSASAEFTASGFKRTFQETIDQVVENRVRQEIVTWGPQQVLQAGVTPPRPPGDPLAQTFFTYGVKGGCFITSVQVFFATKDASIPVRLELRNVDNGYPAADFVSEFAAQTLKPSEVNVSDNASIGTMFVFPRPIYVAEDKDYCFVLISNSNAYNVWTSEMGAKSVETGKVISEQPFIGTLFKSENNITWTAEQNQDIKFNIFRAKFDISAPVSLKLRALAPNDNIPGKYLTSNGSNLVTVTLPMQHGFKSGDTVVWRGITGANYRGASSALISNPVGYTVNRTGDYSFTFTLPGTPFTSAGTLESTGRIETIDIDSGGVNYSSPTVTVVGDGTGADVTLTVDGGVITGFTIVNAGTGYTKAPTLVVADSTGSGAKLVAISDAIFATSINRRYQTASPRLQIVTPSGTDVYGTIREADENYQVGLHRDIDVFGSNVVENEAVLASSNNEQTFFSEQASLEMMLYLESSNQNVSPMVDMRANPHIVLENNIVNDILSNPLSNYDPATELQATGGTAYSRYISQPFQLETISKGAHIFVTACSVASTTFNVYFRSSLAASTTPHKELPWVMMTAETDRNLASKLGEYHDYKFTIDDLPGFDMYDVKIVLSSDSKKEFPVIDTYRVVIIST